MHQLNQHSARGVLGQLTFYFHCLDNIGVVHPEANRSTWVTDIDKRTISSLRHDTIVWMDAELRVFQDLLAIHIEVDSWPQDDKPVGIILIWNWKIGRVVFVSIYIHFKMRHAERRTGLKGLPTCKKSLKARAVRQRYSACDLCRRFRESCSLRLSTNVQPWLPSTISFVPFPASPGMVHAFFNSCSNTSLLWKCDGSIQTCVPWKYHLRNPYLFKRGSCPWTRQL